MTNHNMTVEFLKELQESTETLTLKHRGYLVYVISSIRGATSAINTAINRGDNCLCEDTLDRLKTARAGLICPDHD